MDNDGYMPGGDDYIEYYSCFANIDNVWLKDLEIAKTNNTLNDLTVTIRQPDKNINIDTEMFFSIDGYDEIKYNIKSVQPDYSDSRFMTIIGEVVI